MAQASAPPYVRPSLPWLRICLLHDDEIPAVSHFAFSVHSLLSRLRSRRIVSTRLQCPHYPHFTFAVTIFVFTVSILCLPSEMPNIKASDPECLRPLRSSIFQTATSFPSDSSVVCCRLIIRPLGSTPSPIPLPSQESSCLQRWPPENPQCRPDNPPGDPVALRSLPLGHNLGVCILFDLVTCSLILHVCTPDDDAPPPAAQRTRIKKTGIYSFI